MKGLVKFRNMGNAALLEEARALKDDVEGYLERKGGPVERGEV